MALFTEAVSMAMRDALIDAYGTESIDRSFSERLMELYMAGTIDRETVERLMKAPPVRREPRRTIMAERQLLDVINRAIAEFRHVEGTYDGINWMQLDREHDVASFTLIRLGRPIRDPGPPRHLCECGWPLECYFAQTLPCVTCSASRHDTATIVVDPGTTPQSYYLQVRVILHRDAEARRWVPQPGIGRFVDSRLTEMLEDAGLGRALIPLEPPPTLIAEPPPAGRNVGGMGIRPHIVTDPRWEATPTGYAWMCTQHRPDKGSACMREATHALFSRDDGSRIVLGGAGACDICWAAGARAPLPGQVAPEAAPAAAPAPAPAAPAAEALPQRCSLGLACKVHYPKKIKPFIPAVDDFDLLPDADPSPWWRRR